MVVLHSLILHLLVKRSIDKYLIETRGKGYALNDPIAYANAGNGSSASAKVDRIEGRLIQESNGDDITREWS